ncbi:hypothetical protein FA13DRAFT_1784021 [Coprinellus micaceus]|uniref:Uncharacterized protein n=1 Tax=Coprinellus micaceus TaxID=71717 RepID=A0A4Y7R505_COPMI|nr:hypothetical protein FA13DRAFT_1784021 [Coprinellus micaceus]
MPQGPNHALFYSCAVPPDASSVYNTERIPKIERNRTRLVVPHMVSWGSSEISAYCLCSLLGMQHYFEVGLIQRFGGIPESKIPSSKSLISLCRHMRRETGREWPKQEVESRIRDWMGIVRGEGQRQPSAPSGLSPAPHLQVEDSSCGAPYRSPNRTRPNPTTRGSAYRNSGTSAQERSGREKPAHGTRQDPATLPCSGDWTSAFAGANRFGVGTIHVTNVSCCCGRSA